MTGDLRIVNLLVQRERERREDMSHSRSFAKHLPFADDFARIALECGVAPPLVANNHCQEITSSESEKVVVAPLSGGAFASFPPDHAITPIASGVGPAPVLAL